MLKLAGDPTMRGFWTTATILGYTTAGEFLYRGSVTTPRRGGFPWLWLVAALGLIVAVHVVSTRVLARANAALSDRSVAAHATVAAFLGTLGALAWLELRTRATSVDCLYCAPWQPSVGPALGVAAVAAAMAAGGAWVIRRRGSEPRC